MAEQCAIVKANDSVIRLKNTSMYHYVRDVRLAVAREKKWPEDCGTVMFNGKRVCDAELLSAIGYRFASTSDKEPHLDIKYAAKRYRFSLASQKEIEMIFDETATVETAKKRIVKTYGVEYEAIMIEFKSRIQLDDVKLVDFAGQLIYVKFENYAVVPVSTPEKKGYDHFVVAQDLTVCDFIGQIKARNGTRNMTMNKVDYKWELSLNSRSLAPGDRMKSVKVGKQDVIQSRTSGNWGDKQYECQFMWKGIMIELNLREGAEMPYIRALLCHELSLPIRPVRIHARNFGERLMASRLHDVVVKSKGKPVFDVECEQIIIVLKPRNGKGRETKTKVSPLWQAWDLRKAFANQNRCNPYGLRFWIGDEWLDDREYLSNYIVHQNMTVLYEDVGVYQFSFSDCEGKVTIRQCEIDMTMGELAKCFAGQYNGVVEFEYVRKPLRKDTKLKDINYEPFYDINVTVGDPAIEIVCLDPAFSPTLTVAAGTTVSDVIRDLKKDHSFGVGSLATLTLRYDNNNLNENEVISDGRDLSKPFQLIVTKTEPLVIEVECRFTFNGKQETIKLRSLNLTLGAAKVELEKRFKKSRNQLQVRDTNGRLMNDTDRLCANVPYQVEEIRDVREIRLAFERDWPPTKHSQGLAFNLKVDVFQTKTIGDLADYVVRLCGCDRVADHVFINREKALMTFPLQDLRLEYVVGLRYSFAVPREGLTYHFDLRGKSRPLRIGAGQTVSDVKMDLIDDANYWTSTSRMTFLGIELQDNDEFVQYCIPQNSHIKMQEQMSLAVQVIDPSGNKRDFYMAEYDRVDDLRSFLAFRMKEKLAHILLHIEGCDKLADSDMLLKDLQRRPIRVALSVVNVKFICAGGEKVLKLKRNATIHDALEQLATGMEKEVDDLTMSTNGQIIQDTTTLVTAITTPMEVHFSPQLTFTFEGRDYRCSADFNRELKFVFRDLIQNHGWRCKESDLYVEWNESMIECESPVVEMLDLMGCDPGTSDLPDRISIKRKESALTKTAGSPAIAFNLEKSQDPPAEPKASSNRGKPESQPAEEKVCEILNMTTLIPQPAKFTLMSTMTLAQVEVEIRKKWSNLPVDIEFVETDPETYEFERVISKATTIDGMDFTNPAVAVVTAEDAATIGGDDVTPSEDHPLLMEEQVAEAKPDEMEDLIHQSIRTVRKAEEPKVEDELKTYTFNVEQKGDMGVKLTFPIGATVKDAKQKLAERYSQPIEFFTLLFAGKALRDTFILDRLRIGEKGVVVYIKDMSEVLLVTAKAQRPTNVSSHDDYT